MTAFFRFASSFLFLFFVLCPFVAHGQAVPAKTAGEHAKPTAALIDFARSPLVTLLEAELLTSDSAAWVERTEIARLLNEQKLQKLFAADSGNERSQLGRTLQADLLVLVRNGVAEKVPYLDLVVSEVSRGLRLIRRRVPLTADPKQDVAELLKTVQHGIALQREPIKAIYAVPPFVSEDLLPDYDELRGAFSLLIEQRMQEHPGVIVVELAEAEALAREIAVADGETKVARQLPTYMLGQYRNEGRGAERTINIKLTLQQGAKTLGSNQLTMKPAEAPQYLREKTGNVVARLTGREVPPSDSKAEAAQLARRSKDFSKLGLWEDALTLIQASLLLDPQQPDMHHDAVVANARLCGKVTTFNNFPNDGIDLARVAMGYYLRGLEHQIAFYRLGGEQTRYDNAGSLGGLNSLDSLQNSHVKCGIFLTYSDELKAYLRSVQDRQIELWLDLLRWQVAKGQDDAASKSLSNATYCLEINRYFEVRRRVILELQNERNAMRRTFLFVNSIGPSRTTPEGQRFLEQLVAEGNAQVKSGVAAARQELQANSPAPITYPAPTRPPAPLQPIPNGGKQVRVDAISLKLQDKEWGGFPIQEMNELEEVDGLLSAGPGLDVLWWHDSIYFMRKKGEVKRVWQALATTRARCFPFVGQQRSALCFDGKYVWAPCLRDKGAPYLVVIDTDTERSWHITHEDGLPVTDPQRPGQIFQQPLAIAPLAPGKVCVAGGLDRGWIALLNFSGDAGVQVKVIHEAKNQPQVNREDQWLDPQLVFKPKQAFVLSRRQTTGSESTTEQVVCIGRDSADPTAKQHPLLVNMTTLQVEVMREPFAMDRYPITYWSQDGAVYFCDSLPPDFRRLVLQKLTLPGPRIETVCDLNVSGHVAILGNELLLAGEQWFAGNLGKPDLQAAGPTPWQYHPTTRIAHATPINPDGFALKVLAPSQHYGLFAAYAGRSQYFNAQVKVGIAGSLEMMASSVKAPLLSERPPDWESRHLHLRFQSIGFEGKPAWMEGCVPATPGLDAFWKDGSLYFMRERGKLKTIWEAKTPGSRIANHAEPRGKSAVCFDGKYVWATVLHPTEMPRLLVADVMNDNTWEISAAEGLPFAIGEKSNRTMSLCAIEPGKVCVAGGGDRSWLAMVTFDPAVPPKVDVFHQAAVAANPDDPSQGSNAAIAFQPTFMFLLSAGGSSPQRRLLVGRKSENAAVTQLPLVVNPDTRRVEVLPESPAGGKLSGDKSPLELWLHRGELYSIFPPANDPNRIGLHRMQSPEMKFEYLFDTPDEANLASLDDALVMVSESWWLIDLESKRNRIMGRAPWRFNAQYIPRDPKRTLPEQAPRLVSLTPSHHYGLLVGSSWGNNQQGYTEVYFFPRQKPAP